MYKYSNVFVNNISRIIVLPICISSYWIIKKSFYFFCLRLSYKFIFAPIIETVNIYRNGGFLIKKTIKK